MKDLPRVTAARPGDEFLLESSNGTLPGTVRAPVPAGTIITPGHAIEGDDDFMAEQRPVLKFMGRTISVGDGADPDTTEVSVIDEVPASGTTGQVLTKVSDADYDITWADPAGGGGGGTPGATGDKGWSSDPGPRG